MESWNYFQVALKCPINNGVFTYKADSNLDLAIGDEVNVPFGRGNRQVRGHIFKAETGDIDSHSKIKEITELVEKDKLNSSWLEFIHWCAKYYHYSFGALLNEVVPKAMKRPKSVSELQGQGLDIDLPMNEDQLSIIQKITPTLTSGHNIWPIHGITGSGKSFIYLSLMKEVLSQGKSVLFLLPEINLTPQFMAFCQKYLPGRIFSYHSEVTKSEKHHLWKQVDNDEPYIVVGVRSSIFLPMKNLGLIIVDEEHDKSFKQDDRCPYNAKDMAIKRSQLLDIPVVLGSATPTVETYWLGQTKGQMLEMTKRMGQGVLPEVELVKAPEKNDYWPLNEGLLKEIKSEVEEGRQVIVYLNKIGYAHFLQCTSCGYKYECPNCSVSLRVFKKRRELSCYLCQYKAEYPDQCLDCGNLKLTPKGLGTEKIKEILNTKYPEIRAQRFDRDEITSFNQLQSVLNEFHEGNLDVLIGTQMISKGHNFERVRLVIILGMDGRLHIPDFRGEENVYQQLHQVAGRAGRFDAHGKVKIVTVNPEHRVYQLIKEHDFNQFYKDEIDLRKDLSLPPFSRMAVVYLTGANLSGVQSECGKLEKIFLDMKQKHFNKVDILGPSPSFVEKRVNKFTWYFLFKSNQIGQLHQFLGSIEANCKISSGISMKIDVDPYQIH